MTLIHHDFKNTEDTTNKDDKKEVLIPGYQLRLELSFSSPSIWRTIKVPGTATLSDLHRIIQICFGWDDDATHRFLVGKIFYNPPPLCNENNHCETDFQLHELEEGMGFIFSYIYDGGSGWECEITLEDKIKDAKTIPTPQLIAADRAFPPQSFDDIHEYQDVLQQLERENADIGQILGSYNLSGDYDPAQFDLKAINNRLKTY
ncbi:plasmid pRiA4b ORF-3 family protein [Desulfosediminicola flagellatus]|uniref:plasmid pRiA4b ORF-3 family protein n=1 Tax=Desulfosediminicola flagellatus TaxID=2569541 RepID=UPI00142EF17D|nr:plasmid pRiA4b ORF-3 family protein [Desulfosediminicola flagellatus]